MCHDHGLIAGTRRRVHDPAIATQLAGPFQRIGARGAVEKSIGCVQPRRFAASAERGVGLRLTVTLSFLSSCTNLECRHHSDSINEGVEQNWSGQIARPDPYYS